MRLEGRVLVAHDLSQVPFILSLQPVKQQIASVTTKRTFLAASTGEIVRRIIVVRGHKVMIDADLAQLYGVPTKRLNEQVRRNSNRFADFLFRLTSAERSKVVANCDHLARLKFSPALPYAFTEHGALMAATVLNSPRAVEVSRYVIQAFVQQRELLAAHKDLAGKLADLDRKYAAHDQAIAGIITTIRQMMMAPAETKKKPMGFVHPKQ